MRLLTLGGLSLQDASFGRTKPLLLLTYLALEGPQERRHLAELFWHGASDPMNSLSAALTKLRKGLVGAVEADEVRAWTGIETDAAELLSTLEAGNLDAALELYQGPFLHGTRLSDWGIELEEWVYSKREQLAGRVQRGMLNLAESQAAQADFDKASSTAEAAYTLGDADFEPEELTRLFLVLQAGDNPLVPQIREEAQGFGIALTLSRDEARARLQRVLVGRQRETARLAGLAAGEWAWVQGGAGMGKTALLKSLPGTFLYGRSGLPYATLEPLVGSKLQEGEAAIVQHLLRLEGCWLFDNWDNVDEQSKEVLTRLKALRPRASVVISSREPAPFSVEVRLELGPVSKDALEPEAWQKTHGLPALVEAYLRNEPLESALETRLAALTKDAGDVYLGLALLDEPDIALVRRALGLKAAVTANVLEELLAAGFVEPSGQVRVRQAAQDYLEARPTKLAPLNLNLARELDSTAAFPLFERSRPLWTPADEPKALAAYLAWTDELLNRGFPQQAFKVLEDAPDAEEVVFMKARALERAGRYQEAFEYAQHLENKPEVLALKATLLWRLGKLEAAGKLAREALEKTTTLDTRATALNTLGNLARSTANYEEAVHFFRKAAALWRAQNDRAKWAGALYNVGITWGERGIAPEETEAALHEALEAAGENPILQARIGNSLGSLVYERQQKFDEAKATYRKCIQLHEEFGLLDTAVRAWNNLGVVFHLQAQPEEAKAAYERALELAHQAGDYLMQGNALANLAELTENLEAWEEALRMLTDAGHSRTVERFWVSLADNHPFRARSGGSVQS